MVKGVQQGPVLVGTFFLVADLWYEKRWAVCLDPPRKGNLCGCGLFAQVPILDWEPGGSGANRSKLHSEIVQRRSLDHFRAFGSAGALA